MTPLPAGAGRRSTPPRPIPAARVAAVAALVASTLGLLVLLGLAVLAALPFDPGAAWRRTVLGPGLLYAGLAAALVGAIRLRLAGDGWGRIMAEVLSGGATVAAVGIAVGATRLLALPFSRASAAVGAPAGIVDGIVQAGVLAAFATVLSALAYGAARTIRLAWSAWGRLRRRRLLWSLTHAQLTVTLVLAASVATFLTLRDFHSRDFVLMPAGGADAGAALDEVLGRLASAVAILAVITTGLILLLIVPATLISLAVVRRATRRLEDLAAATASLRAGNLTARVVVGGSDEVARLQSDFNAMAADLEAAMHDLRTERDTVARLLQARRELVAAVSHELRTPVATLRAYLESALDRPPAAPAAPPPALRHDLDVMARETIRLQRMIEDLFALSRVEAGRLPLTSEPVDVGALLHRCVSAAAAVAWERGRVEVLATPPTPPVWALADSGRLEQVVGNLVANAVRHTPPGGLVVLTATASGDGVSIEVKDTGEGIPAEDLPHIWERFYRSAGAPAGGTGLGLALVKELSEAMGGTVVVESTSSQGSVFAVRLPAAPATR